MQLVATEDLARRGQLYPSVILHGGTDRDRQNSAMRLAKVLLCDEPPAERPCGRCRQCTRIAWPGTGEEVFHPDFRVLQRDLKTSISVEATKSFLKLAQVAPFEAAGQVFVVASAEALTGEAANALLKTLEEPPTRTPRNFLLLTPSQLDLLPTIRSRSLPVYLGAGSGPDNEMVEDLAQRLAVSIGSFIESRSTLHLISAAEDLAAAGNWQDPRATEPWIVAAAAVKRCRDLLPDVNPRQMLALSEDLLTGSRLRLRGIQAQRILEGMVVEHLAG